MIMSISNHKTTQVKEFDARNSVRITKKNTLIGFNLALEWGLMLPILLLFHDGTKL